MPTGKTLDVRRGDQNAGCRSEVNGIPAQFLVVEPNGYVTVASRSGETLRFFSGQRESVPSYDNDLRGIESCAGPESYGAFLQTLYQAYAVDASASNGYLSKKLDSDVFWPFGGSYPVGTATARKNDDILRIGIPVRATYYGVPLSRMIFEFGLSYNYSSETFLFDASRSEIKAKFGAALANEEKNRQALYGDSGWAYVQDGEPGAFTCDYSD